LAHLFLPLIGFRGNVLWMLPCTRELKPNCCFSEQSIKPITLGPKEGLALINGTQFILAFAIKAVQRMQNCLDAADIIGAMSLEALTGTEAPLWMQGCMH
jgi:histidine ammonia-lyase